MIRRDLTNRVFGYLTAISPTDNRGLDGCVIWECLCTCGNIKYISSKLLLGGNTKSCGCYGFYTIDKNRQFKICSGCKKEKSITEFNKNKTSKDGHMHYCKICWSEKQKIKRIKSREKRRTYCNLKYKTDVNFKLRLSLRNRIRVVLKNNSKTEKTIQLLGCSVKEFRKYLENKFTSRMSWDNYGNYWEIDHIVPCAKFDLSIPEQQKLCFHYTNLQPLSAIENRIKGACIYG